MNNNDTLGSIVYIIKSINNYSIDSGYTRGNIVLSDSVIEEVTKIISSDLIVEIYIDNKSINTEELSSYENQKAEIQIKTGDVGYYFDTVSDFISGNKFDCKLPEFYIYDIDYKESESNNEILSGYKKNLSIIDFLVNIANNIKKTGNELELFFYKSGVGVNLKINYDVESLQKIDFEVPNDLKSQILDSYNGKDKKELFVNELINLIEKNNLTYIKLLEIWETLISNYRKSYSLFIAGFSFEKIKTSSTEHFQKLVDRIYESIGKTSSYIFGIPIGYILLINNFDFSGTYCFKNVALLILGLVFFFLIWFVLFKNIDESITAIEKDIIDFLTKIQNVKELEEIYEKLDAIKSKELRKQKFKLKFTKGITILIFTITLMVFLMIFFDICIFM